MRNSMSFSREESGRKSKTFGRSQPQSNPNRISEETPEADYKPGESSPYDSRKSKTFERLKKAGRRFSMTGIRRSLELQPATPAASVQKTKRCAGLITPS